MLTRPVSYSQTFKTFWSPDFVTIGTGLRTHALVRFNEPCPVHYCFITEHQAKRGPACIKDGLSHLCAGQRRAVHVAHAN